VMLCALGAGWLPASVCASSLRSPRSSWPPCCGW
jgi:hypothetical protein